MAGIYSGTGTLTINGQEYKISDISFDKGTTMKTGRIEYVVKTRGEKRDGEYTTNESVYLDQELAEHAAKDSAMRGKSERINTGIIKWSVVLLKRIVEEEEIKSYSGLSD